MPFEPSPHVYPAPRTGASGGRLLDCRVEEPEQADVLLAGVPYDASVLGRKGARHGPAGIREAFRFIGGHDPDSGNDLTGLRWHDAGDVAGLRHDDVLTTHAVVRDAVRPFFATGKRVVLLGGDHGLTFPHIQALAESVEGRIGIVVIDAHYDLRSYEGQPSSGTPFRRILEELQGRRVAADNLVEVGIRPYANGADLATYAAQAGVHIVTAAQVRSEGADAVAQQAVAWAADGVDHLWLSIDIDGLDQSIAAGCSAPGAGGLAFHEAAAIVEAVAADPRCRGVDILEVAPELDPTGNTCRTAAQLVAHFIGASGRTANRTD